LKYQLPWLAAAALLSAIGARAQMVNYVPVFPGLYPTGFNSSGDTYATTATSSSEGYADAHYQVVAVDTKVTGYTNYEGAAFATGTSTGWKAPVPFSGLNGSEWIQPPGGTWSGSGYVFPASGATGSVSKGITYDYQIVFTVLSGYALSIGGSLAADNYVDLYLNGQTGSEVALTGANLFSSGAAFSLTSANGLVVGINTLTFSVININTGSSNTKENNPTGLDVFSIGSGTYMTLSAPEVGAFLPAAAAVALYGGLLFARRRSRTKAATGPR
jgi:hypothetical protein